MPETEKLRFSITLPHSLQNPQPSNLIECNGVLVVVGANGTGKTRFGVWLESFPEPHRAHRISAQKSLQFPPEIHPSDLELAEKRLLVGDEHEMLARVERPFVGGSGRKHMP